MKNPNTHNQRIAKMTFASVYPMYLEKVEKKGRTEEELHQVRYLDKLVDELAKGRKMEKILRGS